MLVAVDRTGLVGFGATYHDTVGTNFHDMHEQIGVFLLRGRKAAVALGVGHRAIDGEVVLLNVLHVFGEAFVVVGSESLIHFIGGGPDGVESVHTYAALEAGSGLLTHQTLHLHFLDQVVGALMQMAEAVDSFSDEGRIGRHQVFVFLLLGQFVGHGHRIQGRTDDGVVNRVLDTFSEHIDLQVHFLEAFDVLFCCHHSAKSFLRVCIFLCFFRFVELFRLCRRCLPASERDCKDEHDGKKQNARTAFDSSFPATL